MKSYDDRETYLAVDQNYPNGENFDWLRNFHYEEYVLNGLDATA